MANLWDEEALFSVLEKAHAAGDSGAAKEAARRIKLIRAQKASDREEYNPVAAPKKDFMGKLKELATNPIKSAMAVVSPGLLDVNDEAWAGMGKSFVDTKDGISQLLGLADNAKINEKARLDAPLMKNPDAVGGYIGGQMAQMAVPGGAVSKLGLVPKVLQGAKFLPSAGRAAAASGLFAGAQPVLDGDTRAGNVAAGAAWGAAGQAIPSALGALGRASSKVTPEVKELALKAESMGIPISAAQLSDSRFVKVLNNVVKQLPFSGANKMADVQQKGFNRAVAQTFGENADVVTNDVAARAMQRLRGGFNDVTARNNVRVDSKLMDKLVSIVDESGKTATADNGRIVSNLVDEFLSKTKNGQVSGAAYRQLDSKIGKLMKGQDGDKANWLGQLRDSIRDGMDRSISKADSAKWKQLRGQYKNLKTVEDLIEKAPTGDLSPSLLLNKVRGANKNMAYGGGGDLANLARIGQKFLKDPIQNSTTAEKNMIMSGLGITGGGLSLGIDPASILALLAAGKVGGRMLNSPASSRYVLQGSQGLRRAGQLARPLPFLLPAAANAGEQ